MTARDRTVVMVLAVAALAAAFWFGLLSPKREAANALTTKVQAAQTRLRTAEDSVTAALAAERGYASDYATVARLGKAVPELDDVPSLVYQLQTAAQRSRVAFNSIALGTSGPAAVAAAPATPAAQVAAVGQEEKGQAPATPAAAATAAPATQAAAAVLPPGAAVGAAGFPTMPFDFSFGGTFFGLESFLGRLGKFTSAGGNAIKVQGRLLTVDGIALTGFPKMKATVHATAYLLPGDQGLLAGATPQAPAATGTAASTTTPSTTAPPAATITGLGR